MRVIHQSWQDYKKYFRIWRIAVGLAAYKNTVIADAGDAWELWFNIGGVGIWWRR